MKRSKLDHFAAVLPVADLHSTVQWYKEKLDFHMEFSWGEPVSYVIMKRDALQLHFALADKDYQGQKVQPSLYVFVTEIETLYEEFKQKGVKLGDLVKADYGMTDFDLYDLNGFRISFGQGQ